MNREQQELLVSAKAVVLMLDDLKQFTKNTVITRLKDAIADVEDAMRGPSWDSRSCNHDDILSIDRGGRL